MTRILIIDDDQDFCQIMAGNLEKRGLEVCTAHNVNDAIKAATEFNPEWALTDLKMPDSSGLELIPALLQLNPKIRIVILTGYANISTAIEAIKLGAIHYLAKPVSTDEVIAAFFKDTGNPNIPVETTTLPLEIAKREHILNTLQKNNNNISATARELKMHRRTLQRKLQKNVKN